MIWPRRLLETMHLKGRLLDHLRYGANFVKISYLKKKCERRVNLSKVLPLLMG